MDKITFICPIFNSFPTIIGSLLCQTHKNWELLLIHDGICTTNLSKIITTINDDRITYIEMPTRVGNWGHSLRRWALNEIKENRLSLNCNYIVITNADNYHVPIYCEELLKGFKKNTSLVATYCSKMVHSYIRWDVIDCKLERGYVDCAGVMIKKEVACDVGWRDITSHSSDWTYFEDIIKKYGVHKFLDIKGCLLIHN